MVSGDTGPTHIAAAVGTPIVGIYGPTRPERNGPWRPADVTVSRADSCECHHLRRCRRETMCLMDIEAAEVLDAVERQARRRTALVFDLLARAAHTRSASCSASPRSGSRSRRSRSIALGAAIAAAGRSAADLGRRASSQVARGDRVGSVSLARASALCRLVGDGRRPGRRVGKPRRGAAHRASTWRRRSPRRSGPRRRSCAVGSATRIGSTKPVTRRRPTRRFSFERAIANGEHRTIAGLAAAVLLLALKATYNGLFWRGAGR